MIPNDRPVTARDLLNLRRKLALRSADFLYLFNISMLKWCTIKLKMDAPIKDPAIAILARILDADPSASIIPKPPSPKSLFDRIRSFAPYADMPSRSFGIYFGRDSSASYRWLNQRTPVGPVADRLLLILDNTMTKQGLQGIDWWKGFVDIESKARGIDNVWLEGLWHLGTDEDAADDGVEKDEDSPPRTRKKKAVSKDATEAPKPRRRRTPFKVDE